MLSVHVLAGPMVMGAASSVLAPDPEVQLDTRTNNVREAVNLRLGSDDVILIDDLLLAQAPGLVASIKGVPCRKILVGRVADPDAARRALVLEAVNMVDPDRLSEDLLEVLKSLVQPATVTDPWVGVVYSAKGGVGKSTVALNLAWALAIQSDHDVALMDADPLGDIGAMIQDKPGATLVDVARGLAAGMSEEKALSSLYRVKALGLTVVPAAPSPQDAQKISVEEFETVLRLLAASHPYVVVDVATGLTDLNLIAMDQATEIIVLTAPERVTLGTVKRAVEVLKRLYPNKLALLLNRADSDTGVGVREVEQELSVPVQYVLPSGGSAPVRATNRGRPLVLADAKNTLARAITAIAQEIVGGREGTRRRPRRWFAR